MAFNQGNFGRPSIHDRITAALQQSGGGINPDLDSGENRQRIAQNQISRLDELGRLRDQFEEQDDTNPGGQQLKEAIAKDIKIVMKELADNEKQRARQENLDRKRKGTLGEVKAATPDQIIPDFESIKRDIDPNNVQQVKTQQASQGAVPEGFVPKSASRGPTGKVTTQFGPPAVKLGIPETIIKALGTPGYNQTIANELQKGTIKSSQLASLKQLDQEHQQFGFLPKKQQDAWLNYIHRDELGISEPDALKRLESSMVTNPNQGFWSFLFSDSIDTDAMIFEPAAKLRKDGGLLRPRGN